MIFDSENKFFIIYPIYFNKSKTRAEGRKYSKDLCVNNPTMGSLKAALKTLSDCNFIEESNKRHPKDFDTIGRFKVFSSNDRNAFIKKFMATLNDKLNAKASEGKIINRMKLVPRKKKGKK